MSNPVQNEQEKPRTNIIILGVIGSGKSTIGSLVAHHLGAELVEVDDIVAARLSRSVAELVISRDSGLMETRRDVILDILSHGTSPVQRVIILPASAPTHRDVALAILHERHRGAVVIELVADTAEIARREGLNAPRSVALGAPRALMTLQIQRLRECYEPLVDVNINTVGRSPVTIAQEIFNSL